MANGGRPHDDGAEPTDGAPLVSVIVPLLDEEESVAPLYEELSTVLQRWQRPYELIFINDGSTDATGERLQHLAERDPRVTAIHFRRNYGQTAAMAAGIDFSRGRIIVPMDGDLQNDPADIPALVARLDEGFDVVSGWRRDRRDSFLRTLLSRAANWLISKVSGVELHDYGCTLKAYRREVITGVRLYGEMHRFVPVYAAMQGGQVAEMVVHHRPRRYGTSKYGLGRVWKVVLDLILVKFLMSYSAKPIYIFGGFGLLCLLGSVLTVAMSVAFKIAPEASGWQKDFVETPLPVVSAVLVLVGFLALLQGLSAEILMRTYFESQGKSTYLIKHVSRHCDAAEPVART